MFIVSDIFQKLFIMNKTIILVHLLLIEEAFVRWLTLEEDIVTNGIAGLWFMILPTDVKNLNTEMLTEWWNLIKNIQCFN